MKKTLFLLLFWAGSILSVSAQILPTVQFGIKAGANLTSVSTSSVAGNFKADNRAGFLGGFWLRAGGAGLYFQPEVYYTSKNVNVTSTGSYVQANGDASGTVSVSNKATFNSIDIPLLIGTKFGVLGNGVRLNTGPVLSYAINKNQSAADVREDISHLDYKNQNYAWQFGIGADVRRLSLDLRYEAGLNKVSTSNGDQTRINLFNLTLGYRLLGI